MTTAQDEFRNAFLADDEPAADEALTDGDTEGGATDEAGGVEVAAEVSPTDGAEASDNAPSDSAAEGAGDDAAVAVTLTGEGDEPAAEADASPLDELDDDADVAPEDEQTYKSWRGRLKRREAQIAAREAALADKETAVPALADGGEVGGEYTYAEDVDPMEAARRRMAERDAEYEAKHGKPEADKPAKKAGKSVKSAALKAPVDPEPKWERGAPLVAPEDDKPKWERGAPLVAPEDPKPKWERQEPRTRVAATDLSYGDIKRFADGGEIESEAEPEIEAGPAEGGDFDVDTLKAEASEMAADPSRLRGVLSQMVEDYGRDYVVGLMAAMSPMIDAMAAPYVEGVDSRLAELVESVTSAFQSQHRAAIADAHEDFEQIVGAPEFQAWVESLPDEQKARATDVVENGSAGAIVKLLNEFKSKDKAAARSFEDSWAADAAAGVKSTAPLKIPTRAPASPDDEYKRAWEQM